MKPLNRLNLFSLQEIRTQNGINIVVYRNNKHRYCPAFNRFLMVTLYFIIQSQSSQWKGIRSRRKSRFTVLFFSFLYRSRTCYYSIIIYRIILYIILFNSHYRYSERGIHTNTQVTINVVRLNTLVFLCLSDELLYCSHLVHTNQLRILIIDVVQLTDGIIICRQGHRATLDELENTH